MRRHDREITDYNEIERILQKADVCRIALANNDIPYIITMNFGYTGLPDRSLYFHCANKGRKIEMIKQNNNVCFSLDTDHKIIRGPKGCDWGMSYKSLVGYGSISILTDKESKEIGLNCIMSHYAGKKVFDYDDKVLGRTTILRLDIKEITGKKC